MERIGSFAIPVTIALIILSGLFRRVPVFNTFLDGAGDGLKAMISLVPSLIGLIVAVEMFRASGALDIMTNILTPAADFLRIPAGTLPLFLLRPISGGGSIAILNRILTSYGPDSLTGRCASVMCGSSETTFYTVTVYYGAVGIKRIRHTMIAALVADAAAMIFSSLAVNFFL